MSLAEPVSLKDLVENGAIFNVALDENTSDSEQNEEDDKQYQETVKNFANFNCLGVFDEIKDEDTYVQGQPFDVIALKMVEITTTDNGFVKKRVLRDGYGSLPADLAVVKVQYNAYVEYEAEPFDSTYARRKVHQFCVNNGEVLIGLDIAVQSMKINEKSQFLMTPNFAYGKLGCLGRVPANATVLFEIELLETVDSGAAISFGSLPESKQKEFSEVYKYCLALCARGKDLFGKNIQSAIREYNTACSKLELAQLADYADQQKQEELLLKLYTNLLVCYTRIEEPRKGCINFNKISDLTKGTGHKIPAKVFYNNAKCLQMLGEYNLAMSRLKQAHKLEPRNSEIAGFMLELEQEKKEYLRKEAERGRAMMKN